jgi:hypothetical protein
MSCNDISGRSHGPFEYIAYTVLFPGLKFTGCLETTAKRRCIL